MYTTVIQGGRDDVIDDTFSKIDITERYVEDMMETFCVPYKHTILVSTS